jgi:hypothetical protein
MIQQENILQYRYIFQNSTSLNSKHVIFFNKVIYLTSLQLYGREIGHTLGQRIPNFTAHQVLRSRILGLNNQACLEAFTCIILQYERTKQRQFVHDQHSG